jgi:hypothetical protein
VADVQRLLDEAIAERDSLAAQLAEAKASAASAEAARARAVSAADAAVRQRGALETQLESLQSGLDGEGAAAAAADARISGLQSRIASLQASLATSEAEAERLAGLLAAAEAAAAGARSREDGARGAAREAAERAQRAEVLVQEARSEGEEVRVLFGIQRQGSLQDRQVAHGRVRMRAPTPGTAAQHTRCLDHNPPTAAAAAGGGALCVSRGAQRRGQDGGRAGGAHVSVCSWLLLRVAADRAGCPRLWRPRCTHGLPWLGPSITQPTAPLLPTATQW